MLELINIYKSFTHTGHFIEVLKGIDLTVNPGESLSVTGASGVGKSTLLNIMGTLEPPTEGVVRFDSLNVNELDGAALCRLRNRDIGLVFQFHHLLPEFHYAKLRHAERVARIMARVDPGLRGRCRLCRRRHDCR